MSRRSIIAFGELLWDVLPSGAVLGGAPANFCYRLNSLGLDSRLVSRLGADSLGDKARDQLRELGVDLGLVQTDQNKRTGTVDVTLDLKGSASYVINEDVAYDYIEYSAELAEAVSNAAAICFGTLVQRASKSRDTLYSLLETVEHAHTLRPIRVLDINLRRKCYDRVSVVRSIEHCDILKLNDDEVAEVGNLIGAPKIDPANFVDFVLAKFGIESCLVTRAARGVYAKSRSGETVDIAGHQVTVADTIGAGDAFTAGFIAKRLENSSLSDCCRFGNCLGALVATKTGGMAEFDRGEIEDFVSQVDPEIAGVQISGAESKFI